MKYLVVHCSDSPNTMDIGAEEIHEWHKERGFDGIGYHYVVRRSGEVEEGRPHYWQGAHVRGYNNESLGVCLIGKDEFTMKQMYALEMLLYQLKVLYPNSKVIGHRDLDNKKTCPNFDVKDWWESCKA